MKALVDAAKGCRGCELYRDATQTVFGEGAPGAEVMLVGEQPGDREDREGRPFVGPAGRLLDDALDEAGIDRADVYLTNVVKHFKFEPRGKRRIHRKPDLAEQLACRPWLEAELDAVHPDVLVLLGATAAQALLGRDFRVTTQRGTWVEAPYAPRVTATVHPSSILRAPDDTRAERALFIRDLAMVAGELERLHRGSGRSAYSHSRSMCHASFARSWYRSQTAPPRASTRQYSRSRPSAHQRPSIFQRPITSATSYRRSRHTNAEGMPASCSTLTSTSSS
jgi:uracil-DNA glycosylase